MDSNIEDLKDTTDHTIEVLELRVAYLLDRWAEANENINIWKEVARNWEESYNLCKKNKESFKEEIQILKGKLQEIHDMSMQW